MVSVGLVKGPHPAQVPGRKAGKLRVGFPKVIGGSHRRALFWPQGNSLPDGGILIHLVFIPAQGCFQLSIQIGVVYWFALVHSFPPF